MSDEVNIFESTVAHFLAPIMPFMDDPTVSEIMVNRPDKIYIERSGRIELTTARFDDSDSLEAAIRNILQYTGKRLDVEHPLIDSRLPDGSRVHVVLGSLCRSGTCLTIRKFAKIMFDAEHLIDVGSWTPKAMEYLQQCVLGEKNILVAGGTSCGKTCLLNVLSNFIPPDQRIVVIEDSTELELQQEHILSLETRPPDRWGRGEVTINDLFRSSLRLRPDRVIIGEVRGGEALEMIQAMTSGHAGSMSTLHANTAYDALNRLETMAMMNAVELPLYALRSQISSAIDVVILMTRFSDGQRRLTQVSEILPLDENGRYRVEDIFRLQLDDDGKTALVWTGKTSIFSSEPKMRLLHNQRELTREIFDAKS